MWGDSQQDNDSMKQCVVQAITAKTLLEQTTFRIAKEITTGEIELHRMPETVEEVIEMLIEIVFDHMPSVFVLMYGPAMEADIHHIVITWIINRQAMALVPN